MGYLNDAVNEIDRFLACNGAGEAQRDCMRVAFFMGARSVFDATCEAQRMEEAEGMAFLGECRDECGQFFGDMRRRVFAVIAEVTKRD